MWNISEIRYLLYDESGMFMAIISLLTGIIAWFAFNRKIMRIFAAITIFFTVVLGMNYVDFKYINKPAEVETCIVPYVIGTSYSNAQVILREKGLREQIVGYAGDIIDITENAIVVDQNVGEGSEVAKGTVILISIGSLDKVEVDEKSGVDLSIKVNDYYVFTDGYHYEYRDYENPGDISFVDFKKGVCGTFEYSRPLNELELASWFHGGKMLDALGNEIGEDGNYPSFWANSNGMFAIEFPQNLQPGTYTVELYQYIEGLYLSDSFSILIE